MKKSFFTLDESQLNKWRSRFPKTVHLLVSNFLNDEHFSKSKELENLFFQVDSLFLKNIQILQRKLAKNTQAFEKLKLSSFKDSLAERSEVYVHKTGYLEKILCLIFAWRKKKIDVEIYNLRQEISQTIRNEIIEKNQFLQIKNEIASAMLLHSESSIESANDLHCRVIDVIFTEQMFDKVEQKRNLERQIENTKQEIKFLKEQEKFGIQSVVTEDLKWTFQTRENQRAAQEIYLEKISNQFSTESLELRKEGRDEQISSHKDIP